VKPLSPPDTYGTLEQEVNGLIMNKYPTDTGQAWRPNPPSWVDRLTAYIDHLPLPAPTVYVLVGLVAILLFALNDFLTGQGFLAVMRPFHIVFAVEPIYAIALIWFLDNRAAQALEKIKPLLNCDQTGYEALRYQLTTLPAGRALVASLAGLSIGLAAVVIERAATPRAFAGMMLPGAGRYFTEVWLLGTWFVFGALFYHTYHQLRLISHIYTEHARIDLDQSRPLYNFSQVSALTAIGLLVLPYGWYATVPGLVRDPVGIGFGLIFPIFAVVAFISPLVGVHRLLVDAKERALAENAMALKIARTELYELVKTRALAATSELNDTLLALRSERHALEHTPTWPWQPDTLRSVIAAILLPLALWFIQWLLGRLLEH
jgi:hypothetical protein